MNKNNFLLKNLKKIATVVLIVGIIGGLIFGICTVDTKVELNESLSEYSIQSGVYGQNMTTLYMALHISEVGDRMNSLIIADIFCGLFIVAGIVGLVVDNKLKKKGE